MESPPPLPKPIYDDDNMGDNAESEEHIEDAEAEAEAEVVASNDDGDGDGANGGDGGVFHEEDDNVIFYGDSALSLPSNIEHRPCKGLSDVWKFYKELVTPFERAGAAVETPSKRAAGAFTHICIVCLKNISEENEEGGDDEESWQKALCKVRSTHNATAHLISKHKGDQNVIEFLNKKHQTKSSVEEAKRAREEMEMDEDAEIDDRYQTFGSIKRACIKTEEESPPKKIKTEQHRFGYSAIGLPPCVNIRSCIGTSRVWSYFNELVKPILRPTAAEDKSNNTPRKPTSPVHYTHVCLLCLKKVRNDPSANMDSWRRSLCCINKTHNGLSHLKAKHSEEKSVMEILDAKAKGIPLNMAASAATTEGKVVEDPNKMNFTQWMNYFRPVAKTLAKHPQQRLFRAMMDGVKRAALEEDVVEESGDPLKTFEC